MKPLRIVIILVVLGLAAAAVWLAGSGGEGAPAQQADTESAYDYEAQDVVVRQMGPDGRQLYQLDARQIAQLPRSGEISATDLVMIHDPPEAAPGSDSRWTLSARRGQLPAAGNVVTLESEVRASGRLEGTSAPLLVTAARLDYDLSQQLLTSEDAVRASWSGIAFEGSGLRVNIKTGEWALQSEIHATISP